MATQLQGSNCGQKTHAWPVPPLLSCLAVCLLPVCYFWWAARDQACPGLKGYRGERGVKAQILWCWWATDAFFWLRIWKKISSAWSNCDSKTSTILYSERVSVAVWVVVFASRCPPHHHCPILFLNAALWCYSVLMFSIDPNLGAQARSNKQNVCVCVFFVFEWVNRRREIRIEDGPRERRRWQ